MRRDSYHSDLSPSCKCALTECSIVWRQISDAKIYGWSNGRIGYEFSSFALAGSTLEAYLRHVLSYTRYKPICGQKYKPIASSLQDMSIANATASIASSDCPKDVSSGTPSPWATGDLYIPPAPETKRDFSVFNKKSMNPVSQELSAQCHQRIHSRGSRNVYVSGTGGCGVDAIYLHINYPCMAAPLSICPRSIQRYADRESSVMDDDLFLGLLHIYLRLPLKQANLLESIGTDLSFSGRVVISHRSIEFE